MKRRATFLLRAVTLIAAYCLALAKNGSSSDLAPQPPEMVTHRARNLRSVRALSESEILHRQQEQQQHRRKRRYLDVVEGGGTTAIITPIVETTTTTSTVKEEPAAVQEQPVPPPEPKDHAATTMEEKPDAPSSDKKPQPKEQQEATIDEASDPAPERAEEKGQHKDHYPEQGKKHSSDKNKKHGKKKGGGARKRGHKPKVHPQSNNTKKEEPKGNIQWIETGGELLHRIRESTSKYFISESEKKGHHHDAEPRDQRQHHIAHHPAVIGGDELPLRYHPDVIVADHSSS